jgi:CBS domain-containing protein
MEVARSRIEEGVHDAGDSVRPYMSRGLVSVRPGTSAFDAKALLRTKGIHHAPVVECGDLLGMVCTCDLWNAHPYDRLYWLMSRRVITVRVTASVIAAAKIMLETGVGCLPVIDESRICGVITREDLVRAGIPFERSGGVCAMCGSHRHVPPRRSRTTLSLCRECMDRSAPPASEEEDLYLDLGVAD